MYKAFFMALIFIGSSVHLSAQQLIRHVDGHLAVELFDLPTEKYTCPPAEKMTVVLFEKVNKSEEKTCSGKNTWDKVEEFIVERGRRVALSKFDQGVYKAEIELKYKCEQSSRSISQIIATNILQELETTAAVKNQLGKNELSIYPNPSLDKFILNINEETGKSTSDYTLKVYAGHGVLLFEKVVPYATRRHFEIDLKELPSGQYTFSVMQAERAIGNVQAFKINQ